MKTESQPPSAEPDLNWVDRGVTETRADVCQVISSREETMLLFGTRKAPSTDGAQHATLDRRIILTPGLAKELVGNLKDFLRAYEASRGSSNAMPAGYIQSAPGDDDAPEGARPLLRMVRDLDVGFGFEKSFKLSPGSVLADRMILGVRTRLTDAKSLLGICREIGMPEAHLALFEKSLPDANTAGFGFEGSPQGGMFKVYLEFWERLRQRVATTTEPDLLFLGFKWDARDSSRSALARYTCYPLLSIEGILQRLDALYEDRGDSPSLQTTREIIALAARRIGNDSFVYVEAAEEGNPRKSFDINFYKAGLQVADLQPALSALWQHYAIPGKPGEGLPAQIGEYPFGHLSGGLGRDGRDFLTVYYELEGI